MFRKNLFDKVGSLFLFEKSLDYKNTILKSKRF